jgi:succinate dehydrogenase/fumarate reductase flavoprotein subunit
MDSTPAAAAAAAQRVEADVVVIGGGGSGLAAAIEAASLGRRTVLIERNDRLGGSTAKSIGSFTATNTPHQLRKGIRDCPDDHFEDMARFSAASKRVRESRYPIQDNTALRRVFVDNVPETFRWIMSMGVEFYGPLPEAPHRKPRMHNVLPNSGAYAYHLEKAARKQGVKIVTFARAQRLVIESGAVAGVVCEGPQGPVEYRARGGVVLTTGDFSGDAEMRTQFLSEGFADVQPVNPANAGDGHKMVTGLGGRIVHTGLHSAGIRFQPPPPSWITALPPQRFFMRMVNWAMETLPTAVLRPVVMSFLTTILVPSPKLFRAGALLINARGERFLDELESPSDTSTPVLAQQPGRIAYVLLDGRLAEQFSRWPHYISTAPGFAYAFVPDYRRTRKDIFHETPTLEALAQRIGASPAALRKTVDDFNASLADPARAAGRAPLGRGPFIAMGPVRHYLNFSDSGVAVDTRLRVLGPKDEPIPGLYAAGFIGMGGMLLEGHGHHIGWAFTSGRLAGRHAAYRVVTADLETAPSAASGTASGVRHV